MGIHLADLEFLLGSVTLKPQDVMATSLYDGNGGTQTVSNGLDLAGKGGLLWIKERNATTEGHRLRDTVRDVNNFLQSNTTGAEQNGSGWSVSSTGFTHAFTSSGSNYAAWSFRRAPKFFDIVTYTGNGVAGRQIAHNLGTTPGMIIVKKRNAVSNWAGYHRSVGGTKVLPLNNTNAALTSSSTWNNTEPTATVFTIGTDGDVNDVGQTYVAYLFAHDPAPSGIIQCGSYTGNGSTSGPVINLGWKPQWLLVKRADGVSDWLVFDTARGLGTGAEAFLYPNSSSPEASQDVLNVSSTGFQPNSASAATNVSGNTYVYMAIRSRIPTANEIAINDMLVGSFATKTYTGNGSTLSINNGLDMAGKGALAWIKSRSVSSDHSLFDTARGPNAILSTNNTNAQATATASLTAFNSNGFTLGADGSYLTSNNSGTTYASWSFTRQAKFFDIVTYTGNGVAGRQISHSLGVVPGMIVVKTRSTAQDWFVFHRSLGNNYLNLNTTAAAANANPGQPWTSTNLVGLNDLGLNTNGITYVAYIFAQNTDLIDCGSYVGNAGTNVITCGSGWSPQWLLVKNTVQSSPWFILDTSRSPSNPKQAALFPNAPTAETSAVDYAVSFNSLGFQIGNTGDIANGSGKNYIYMAIREPLI